LLDGIEPGALATLIAHRNEHPFASVDDFRAQLPSGVPIIDSSLVSVNTNYFLVSVRARQGETVALARALIKRDATAASTVWQTIE
jgi:type II secretory pathway component PulK